MRYRAGVTLRFEQQKQLPLPMQLLTRIAFCDLRRGAKIVLLCVNVKNSLVERATKVFQAAARRRNLAS